MMLSFGRRKRLEDSIYYFLIAIVLLFFLFPIYWIFITSIKVQSDVFAIPPKFLFTPTLSNYEEVFLGKTVGGAGSVIGGTSTTDFTRFIWNSLVISSAATGLALLCGVLAAYAIVRFKFRGKRDVAYWILTTRMAPPIAILIPFFMFFRTLGMIDTYPALIIVDLTIALPLAIWMMAGFFQGIPLELEESAMVDGCSRMGAFFRVALPLSAPGLAATAILALIFCWNDFIFALALTGMTTKTAPVAIYNFVSFEEIRWGPLTAAGIVVMLPVIIFSYIVQKWLIQGLTLGAIKG